MRLQKELQRIKNNLIDNLWHIINKEPLDYFKFGEFLESILINSGREIMTHDLLFLTENVLKLNEEYAKLIDHIDHKIMLGEILKTEKEIKTAVNGKFTNIITNFLNQYDKKTN